MKPGNVLVTVTPSVLSSARTPAANIMAAALLAL
jgi:hypothetical protein